MPKLTAAQTSFLKRHGIAGEQVYDAQGSPRSIYGPAMRVAGLTVAINVSECVRGHQLRDKHGKCVQCNPASFAFSRRKNALADVYVAWSRTLRLVKFGMSSDVPNRLYIANLEGYGGAQDWRAEHKLRTKQAGVLENKLHNALRGFRISKDWCRAGKMITTKELYCCTIKHACSALADLSR